MVQYTQLRYDTIRESLVSLFLRLSRIFPFLAVFQRHNNIWPIDNCSSTLSYRWSSFSFAPNTMLIVTFNILRVRRGSLWILHNNDLTSCSNVAWAGKEWCTEIPGVIEGLKR